MGLVIHQERIVDKKQFIECCPFHAMEIVDGDVQINAACKMCKLCVNKSKNGEVEYLEDKVAVDKSQWSGICVYVDYEDGDIHPVTFELIGKARELAEKSGQSVFCLLLGSDVGTAAEALLHYGVDAVFVYDTPRLGHFQIEPYTAAFEDFVNRNKPSVILVGATPVGRQLAPRLAARLRTGLTADCTVLDILDNTDLVQIRPAFGGNIMAQIITPNHRPQLATVRYKVMNAPVCTAQASGKIVSCSIDEKMLSSNIRVLSVRHKEKTRSLEQVEVLVAAGRGVKKKEDLALLQTLAELLGGELACTRPLAEAGWLDGGRQIGLSGRTVRPKLIIACGVSGAVQFSAGMKSADKIIAINKDEKAPIFSVAHIGLVGDLYDIVPRLIEKLQQGGEGCDYVVQSV
ncbi:MAG: electron transfer flavoprotein subunit alpha/FixB family protein [Oscillospiraceae bacterium]|nr:electron transfer flavoprotein subunit alpha/FixB family protein [Oscillospiraceae bacterium]MDD4546648.1 electron transfer flavoprotein subunit alpha/FixB family protein [Oscillospiraceae bacterium]